MALREAVLTYVELVAAANSGDGAARVELAIVERRMLNQGAAAQDAPSDAGVIALGGNRPESA